MATKANRSKASKSPKARNGRQKAPAPKPEKWKSTRKFLHKRSAFIWLLAAVGLSTMMAANSLDQAKAKLLYSEGQLIENATVLLYGVALALLLGWSKGERELRLLIALVVSLCAFRELDLHKAYTSESLLKISYYIKGDDPILGRIVAGIVLIAILALLFRMLVYCRNLWAELRAGRPYAFSALTAILMLPISKAFDSSPRMIHKHLGISLDRELRHGLLLTEESLELAVPLLIILSIAQFNTPPPDEIPKPAKKPDKS